MSAQTEMFLATFRPHGGEGRFIMDRLPVDERGIRTDQRKTVMAVTLDTFEIEAVRKYLPSLGFKLIDRSVHPVSYGKNFFFDMHVERA